MVALILRFCAVVALVAAMAPVSALAQVDRAAAETQIKAAFLYKFSGFVEWPPKAFARPDSPFTIGVIGADELAAELEQIVRGRTVLGAPEAAGRGASHDADGAPRRDRGDGGLRPANLPAEPDLRHDDAGGPARADHRARADLRRPPGGAGKPRAASLPPADPCGGNLQRKGKNLRQLFGQRRPGVPEAAGGRCNPHRGQ